MRVLIVSYYFPPAAGGGVQRVLSWCRYLPEYGWDVHVLAPDDPRWIDSGGGLEVPSDTIVHRSENPSPASLRPREYVAAARGPLHRMWRRLVLLPRRIRIPDMHIGWARPSVRAGMRVVREHDIDLIISSSPPETTHVIASRIARRTGIPWIADYRDSWLDLPHLRLDRPTVRFKHALNRLLARRVMRGAKAVTTVSDPLAHDLRRRHPKLRVEVVTNGVDTAQLMNLPHPSSLLDGTTRDDRFVVSYTGNFFGRQSPQSFLAAVTRLMERRPDIPGLMRIRFVGGIKAEDHAVIDASQQLSSMVERIPFMDYRDVLAEQAAADLLLLYVAPGHGSAGVFTGKVFEYVASARPVLALVPEGNVCIDLLTQAGTGRVVDPDDVESIAATLEAEFDQWRANGRTEYTVPEAVLQSISREHLAGRVAQLAAELQGSAPEVRTLA